LSGKVLLHFYTEGDKEKKSNPTNLFSFNEDEIIFFIICLKEKAN
jgi:hypothetical protein